jgi:hypothetical protein
VSKDVKENTHDAEQGDAADLFTMTEELFEYCDMKAVRNRRYKLHRVKEVLETPQAWMLCSIAFLQCVGGGLTSLSAPPARLFFFSDHGLLHSSTILRL